MNEIALLRARRAIVFTLSDDELVGYDELGLCA